MTALSDALAAAQARAVAALAKAYVGGTISEERVRDALPLVGLKDPTDSDEWLAALDILKELGGAAPAEAKPATDGKPEPASDAQLAYIAKLVKDSGVQAPDLPLTKAQASEVIETIKAGTYDPVKWSVPF